MTQMGMQMPGRARKRPPQLNAYTGLLLCAVICLGVALFLVAQAAMTVGPEGGALNAIKLHPERGDIRLND